MWRRRKFPSPSASDYPLGSPQPVFTSEADLAALPSTLGGVMSVVPPLTAWHPRAAPAGFRGACGSAKPSQCEPPAAPSPRPVPLTCGPPVRFVPPLLGGRFGTARER